MTVLGRGNDDEVLFTLCSRVRHWDRLWSSLVKGEGY